MVVMWRILMIWFCSMQVAFRREITIIIGRGVSTCSASAAIALRLVLAGAQGRDTFLQRRVGEKQPFPPFGAATGDAESGQLIR